jgi:hypothetical protein
VGDTCGGGSCQPGGPLSCDDGNVCTDDTCNPVSGCQTTNNTNPCDDGDPGTVNDTCAGGVCTGESACEPHGRPRSRGYYERLCHRRHSGDWLSDAEVACVAEISDTFAHVASIEDVCDELHSPRRDDDDDDGGGPHDDDDDGHFTGGHGDGGHDDDDDDGEGGNKCEKAEEDLLATALNICKQKVCLDQGLDSRCNDDLDTVGESFSSADALLANPNRRRSDCKKAQCQAREINNGRALDWNSLAITHVANQIRLDWEAPLVELDSPPIVGYRIYRRLVGTQDPFEEIGTSPTPHFVDPTGVAGAHEYEIVAY